jgi:hypothetical protein
LKLQSTGLYSERYEILLTSTITNVLRQSKYAYNILKVPSKAPPPPPRSIKRDRITGGTSERKGQRRSKRSVLGTCPLIRSVHHNFARDGRYSERLRTFTPHPPPAGLNLPYNGMYARNWPLPVYLYPVACGRNNAAKCRGIHSPVILMFDRSLIIFFILYFYLYHVPRKTLCVSKTDKILDKNNI